jgi:sulfatase maturation enzyme AslB (radical SAM superfamily)
VDIGVDTSAIHNIFASFYEDALKTCRTCWGQRLCGICIADTIKDGRFDKETKTQACRDALSILENNLKSYVRILANNPNAFHQSTPLIQQKSFRDIIEDQELDQFT